MLGQKEGMKVSAKVAAEKIAFYVLIGAVLGARLGDLLFYQPLGYLLSDPLVIFRFWEGGLASHGGAVGILLALVILATGKRKKMLNLSFREILDFVVAPTALAGVLIRVGNFFNQEILGTATVLPWGVQFLHPADGSAPLVRHPAQLYESVVYLGVFALLFALWKWRPAARAPGRLSGLFLILVFSARFAIEFVKVEQSVHLNGDGVFRMGQLLSLPFVGLGVLFLMLARKRGLAAANEGNRD